MLLDLEAIKARIPHRDPFLLVDGVIAFSAEEKTITCEKTFAADMDVFRGHYPGNPIVPGVLLSEAIFQAGALLMSLLGNEETVDGNNALVPVLTRIGGAKFKRFAGPGDRLEIKVALVEQVGPASIFKGKLFVADKLAVQIEFTCALVEKA